ncbi:MAG: HAD-IC family P-type ATPase [Candidatus Kerfeldbacteria bacterium]|nr:HAD-IC family P-type ATPase [Candidatus Kerfeldbacteria bacterium]
MSESYSTQSIAHVLSSVATTAEGLTVPEATRRLATHGANQIASRDRIAAPRILAEQFKSLLIVILLVAAGITYLLNDHIDTFVILAAVGVNVLVGFIQEYRAQRSLERLRSVVTQYAVVRRNGTRIRINAIEVVIGDIVYVSSGDTVPADIRLLTAEDLAINESSLTGESAPIKKITEALPSSVLLAEQRNMAFMGTTVVQGSGAGVVVHTGMQTELGKIAAMIAAAPEEQTPLQKKLIGLGRLIGYIVLGAALLIFLIGLLFGYELRETFATAVALAVAAIPEGLAVVVTVTLAIGMQQILKKRALVRKLVAAETLGSITVICTDKTGTLTEGEMRVVRIITFDNDVATHAISEADEAPAKSFFTALQVGVLASDASIENPDEAIEHRSVIGTPTEKALILVASQAGIDLVALRRQHPRLDVAPFNSSTKFMVSLNAHATDGAMLNIKGAPEIILRHAKFVDLDGKKRALDKRMRDTLQHQYQDLSSQGLRLLALAYTPADSKLKKIPEGEAALADLIFVGFAVIKDPLRSDASETIRRCQAAGIRPIMLTGDHRLTARAIAAEIGLPHADENIIEGAAFAQLSREELMARISSISVYARVTPADKLRIIDAWQERGEVVAMTGDGVNDAPALKSADIGVALGSGTDVAKETADMVLLKNNFSTIVHAVEQGRILYDNIKKSVLFLLSDSFTLMILVVLSLFFGWPLPLLAAQILWINLVTDSFPSIGLTMEPGEPDAMQQPPVPRTQPIVDRKTKLLIASVSVLTGFLLLGVFYLQWKITGDLERARSTTFVAGAIGTLMYSFAYRSIRHHVWERNPFSNRYLLLGVLVGILLQLPVIYMPALQEIFQTVPLNLTDWLIAMPTGFGAIAIIELLKTVFQTRIRRVQQA